MKPPTARTNNKTLQQQAEAQETKRRQENARKAKEAADQLFPGEKWILKEDSIYLSPRRPIAGKPFQDEMHISRILREAGNTVYLVPEVRSAPGKKYDAIVNGLMYEYKTVGGTANTLGTHFLRSREQAPNVFINLEKSNLTLHEIIAALYSARNSKLRMSSRGTTIRGYAEYNKFSGGRIVLKLKGHKNLVYLNVDDLKAH